MVMVALEPPHSPAAVAPRWRPRGGCAGIRQSHPSPIKSPGRPEQGLPHLEIILRLEELEQRPLQLAVAQVLGDVDLFARERVEPGVVHARGDVERRGDEILHLVGPVAVALEEDREVDHRVQVAAGMRRDEIGNEVLLFARAACSLP